MAVRIELDRTGFCTNMDFVTGKVVLSLQTEDTISAVTVKLEGECYSRRDQRQGVAMENHKILYKVSQVFPDVSRPAPLVPSYTLKAGIHEWRFSLKLPFNNSCCEPDLQPMPNSFNLNGLQQMQYRHVRKTLPPSLTGFPGMLEIRYYVKVTVQRPSLFKENRRSAIGFRFMPIEPPRPPEPTVKNEVFAKRPYVFKAGSAKGHPSKTATPLSDTAPTGEVDCRLPSPPILTSNSPMPLRVIAKKTNQSAEHVFLNSLQVHLVGTTEIRAQGLMKLMTSVWSLMSLDELSMPLISPEDAIGAETLMDSKMWDQIPLPNTIAPSFVTCNVTRRYVLEVRVGLVHGHPGSLQPQVITLPLKFDVEVYSGITPPTALLDAMSNRPKPSNRPPQVAAPSTSAQPIYDPLYPPQMGTPGASQMDDAPPSYEDAIAEDIAPANGPRPPFSGITDVNAPETDRKASAFNKGQMPNGGVS